MNNINYKYLGIFLIACGLAVGSVLVYAKNHMSDIGSNPKGYQLTQFSNPAVADQTSQSQQVQTYGQQPAGSIDSASQQSGDQQVQQSQQSVAGAQSNSQQTAQQQVSTGPKAPPSSLPPYTGGDVTQLQIKDEVIGNGPAVKAGDTVEVNYIGTFLDGKKFDASYDRNQTFRFTVGAGNVIQGWDQGLVGMQAGGKRLLIIPSDLGYGASGAGASIPPNTPLMFEIELVSIN